MVFQSVTMQTNQSADQFVKQLRNCFEPGIGPSYEPRKVRQRTSDTLGFLRHPHDWKTLLERRCQQRTRGFFSSQAQPYAELGYVELNVKDLVFDTLKTNGHVKTLKDNKSKKKQDLCQEYHNEDFIGEHSQDSQLSSSVSVHDNHLRKQDFQDGGQSIRAFLNDTEERIVAVHAGQSMNCIQRKQRKRKESTISKHSKHERQAFEMKLIEIDDSLLAVVNRDQDGDSDSDVAFLCKNVELFKKKLACILQIFNTIYNMKSKELRNKLPLSLETLKSLNRPVPLDAHGNPCPNRAPRLSVVPFFLSSINKNYRLSNEQQREGDMATLSSPGNLPALSVVQLEETKSTNCHVSASGDGDDHAKQEMFLSAGTGPLRPKKSIIAPKPSAVITEPRIDTWDDLVATDKDLIGPNTDNADTDSGRNTRASLQTYKQTLIGLLKPRRGAIFHKTSTNPTQETMPLWQRIISDERETEDVKTCRAATAKRKGAKYDRQEYIVRDLKESVAKAKQREAEKVQGILEKRQRFHLQRNDFLSIGLLRESDLEAMREKARQFQKEVIQTVVKPSVWMEELTEENHLLRLDNDQESKEKLENLRKFSVVDVTMLPNIKAKLCLIVMSLPVYQLCEEAMKSGLKFFMERILDMDSNSTLYHWLQHRKLHRLII